MAITADQALQNAREAFRKGDERNAFHWAQQAITMAPHLEEPWLILAAVSSSQASISYLEQALIINPNSQRAREGLRWAQKRLPAQVEDSSPPGQPLYPATDLPKNNSQRQPFSDNFFMALSASLLLSLGMIALVLIAWLAWSWNIPYVQALFDGNSTSQDHLPQIVGTTLAMAQPSNTPTQPLSFTSTPTFTPTPNPTNTLAPTLYPKQIPTLNSSAGKDQPVKLLLLKTPSLEGPKRIIVVLSEQHLYAYQGEKLVYSFVASTGRANGTRIGNFRILDKVHNAYSDPWNFYMPNWMGIYWETNNLENGIHALPVFPNGQQLWGNALGTSVTYGCVVLGPEDAKTLFDWAEVGTPVEIRK